MMCEKSSSVVKNLKGLSENLLYIVQERQLILKEFYDFVMSKVKNNLTLEDCYKKAEGLGMERRYVVFFLKRWKIKVKE